MPKTPEQLRAKLRLMGNMWCFLFLRYRKAWLADVTPEVFPRYADFLLGEKVYAMPFPESGQFMLPWNLVITYDLEIRREVCRKINDEGLTMGSALTLACRDTYLRDVYLIAPATLAAAAAAGALLEVVVTGAGRQ